MLWLLWVLALWAVLVIYFRTYYSKFEKRGVKVDSVVPFFGSLTRVMFRLDHLVHSLSRTYYKYPNEKFVGRYEFTKPVLLIRDLDLIKNITTKDFQYFLDHRAVVATEIDPFFARGLFSLKGQEWKDMRSAMSPAFTSSKIRAMVPFMLEVGDQMILNIKKTIKESGSTYLDVDMKDLTTRYSNDVIASCVFGLKVDSYRERDNEFYKQGLIAVNFNFKQFILFFLASSVPWLSNVLKLKLFEKETQDFFRKLVLSTMNEREEKNIIRPDMIHLLMEAKKGKLIYDEKTQKSNAGFATVEESAEGKKTVTRDWADDDLVSQAFIFFFGGFETIASTTTFLLYELAVNPDIQERLVTEIKETHAKTGGKLDFDMIQQMKYMDMVVSELFRKWSPGAVLDRICTKDYNLGKPNDKATEDYIIRKGEGLQIPVWAFHMNPEYFPDPEKFDPERFSDENKHRIKPYTYMPFGLGPRNCIASRFALCDVKVLAYQLLLHLEVSPSPRTIIPAQLDTSTFIIRMRGGHWLRLKARS